MNEFEYNLAKSNAEWLYSHATQQIILLGIPGSPELWELRNYYSRLRMELRLHLMDLEATWEEYRC